jgi:hypothetical protein
VWSSPRASIPTAPPRLIVVGVLRLVVVLSPSWPRLFRPQHLSAELACTLPYAHVWASPSASILTTAPPESIVVGVLRLVVVPSPSWLALFEPQHWRSVLAGRYAHEWVPPRPSRANVSGGWRGGEGGGGDTRGPQSVQSVPRVQIEYSAPAPPSSQSPSEA